MNNTTTAASLEEPLPPTLLEDVIVGVSYFISSVVVGLFYLPCMIVMVKVNDLWKNSCIKVRDNCEHIHFISFSS
jgi:hypothetical protein